MNRDDLERQDEETLLQARTNELKQRTAALALERGPYDHAAYESLRRRLSNTSKTSRTIASGSFEMPRLSQNKPDSHSSRTIDGVGVSSLTFRSTRELPTPSSLTLLRSAELGVIRGRRRRDILNRLEIGDWRWSCALIGSAGRTGRSA